MFKEKSLIFQNSPSERPDIPQQAETKEKSSTEQFKEALTKNKVLLENAKKSLDSLSSKGSELLKKDIEKALAYTERTLNQENLNVEKVERALTEITKILNKTENYLNGRKMADYVLSEEDTDDTTLAAEANPKPENSKKEDSRARGEAMAKYVLGGTGEELAQDIKKDLGAENGPAPIPPLE